tara:strand:+ start:495 stop:1043 length:549 start_codon:yes stop_codon:yes gene_type:complete
MITKIKAYSSKNKTKLRNLTNSLWCFCIILLTWYILVGHKYRFYYNHGASMEPTHYDGEWIIGEVDPKYTPRKYDLVIIDVDGEKLTKRIMGIEGEHIEIKNGKIFTNNEETLDPFGQGDIIYWTEAKEERDKKPKKEWLFFNVLQDVGLIPEGYVFLIGDNREISWYGVIKISEIKAEVIF